MDRAKVCALGAFLQQPEQFGEVFGQFVPACRDAVWRDALDVEDEDAAETPDADAALMDALCDFASTHNRWYAHRRLKAADARVTVHGTVYSLDSAADVQALAAVMAPAPFGDLVAQETRVDPSVRDALQLPADGVVPHFVDAAKLAEAVHDMFGAGVEVQAYRLNLYWRGGHFEEHVDTPVEASRVIGTAVVKYAPGKRNEPAPSFTLRHPDRPEDVQEFCSCREVVVYPSHTPHAVPAVQTDWRVAMVYSILRGEGPTKRARVTGSLTECVRARVARRPLALVTSRRYTFAAYEEYGDAMLQGEDRALFDAVTQGEGVWCRVVFVAFRVTTQSEEDRHTGTTSDVYYISKATIDRHIRRLLYAPSGDTPAEQCNPFDVPVDCLYMPHLSDAHVHTLERVEYVEWAGNECQPGSSDHLYQNAALVFYNPAATRVRAAK